MAKLTNVSCEYTGGGIYVFTALLNYEVWFTTDFMTYDNYGCYDAPPYIVEDDLRPDGTINYDGHWKDPSAPLPQWIEIVMVVREKYGDSMADEISKRLPADKYCRVGETEPPYHNNITERMTTLSMFIEVFEEFLEERGIDVPNDEKDGDPDASTIYGSDYGELSDRIESLLVRLGMMEREE